MLKNRMRGRLAVATIAVALGAALGMPGVADAADGPFLVAGSQDSPVTSQGQRFLDKTFFVNRTGDRIVVSGSSDGSQPFYVDDLLQVNVTHPDGTVVATTIDDSNGCTADTVLTHDPVNVARFLQYGMNKVHVVFRDACGGDYGNSDIFIQGAASFFPLRDSLPALDGGTRIVVRYINPALNDRQGRHPGETCTTAFGVSSLSGTQELTAKHCLDRNQGDQSTNQYLLPPNAPVDIRTADERFTFAQQLSCLSGIPTCIYPSPSATPSGDMVAFAPDTARVTPNVQTARGLLPVVGETTLAALPAGTQICHYGQGSLTRYGNAEQCGVSAGISTGRYQGQPVAAGLGIVTSRGAGGDSGGPVYTYVRNAAGTPVGVYALGVTIISVPSGGSPTIFVPIRAVESNLAVRLLTAPPLTAF